MNDISALSRRSFVAASVLATGADSSAHSISTPIKGNIADNEPLYESSLGQLAMAIGTIPSWPTVDPKVCPDWGPSLLLASLCQLIRHADMRAAIAIFMSIQARQTGYSVVGTRAKVVILLDIIFSASDAQARIVRDSITIWRTTPISETPGKPRADLVDILLWDNNGPQYGWLQAAGGGIGGAQPSMLKELDRRYESKTPYREGLPNVQRSLMDGVPGSPDRSLPFLIARIAKISSKTTNP